jgi:hypothetical protein
MTTRLTNKTYQILHRNKIFAKIEARMYSTTGLFQTDKYFFFREINVINIHKTNTQPLPR